MLEILKQAYQRIVQKLSILPPSVLGLSRGQNTVINLTQHDRALAPLAFSRRENFKYFLRDLGEAIRSKYANLFLIAFGTSAASAGLLIAAERFGGMVMPEYAIALLPVTVVTVVVNGVVREAYKKKTKAKLLQDTAELEQMIVNLSEIDKAMLLKDAAFLAKLHDRIYGNRPEKFMLASTTAIRGIFDIIGVMGGIFVYFIIYELLFHTENKTISNTAFGVGVTTAVTVGGTNSILNSLADWEAPLEIPRKVRNAAVDIICDNIFSNMNGKNIDLTTAQKFILWNAQVEAELKEKMKQKCVENVVTAIQRSPL